MNHQNTLKKPALLAGFFNLCFMGVKMEDHHDLHH